MAMRSFFMLMVCLAGPLSAAEIRTGYTLEFPLAGEQHTLELFSKEDMGVALENVCVKEWAVESPLVIDASTPGFSDLVWANMYVDFDEHYIDTRKAFKYLTRIEARLVDFEPTPQRVRLQFDFIETPPAGVSVPEPSAVLLVGLMLAGSAARRWR